MEKFNLFIETNRLIVRPLEPEDYPVWLSGFENRLPSQHKYDDGKIDMSICTREWFDDLVKNHQSLAVDDKVYVFGVFRKEDGAHLGAIDFSTLMREDFQWARCGYTLHNQYWRQGYGKEALKAAIQLAFDGLNYHRIEAHINLDNAPSVQLAKSVGMEYECLRKAFVYENEAWTDHLVYFINDEEKQ